VRRCVSKVTYDRNDRLNRERKRKPTSFSHCFSNAEAETADKWLRSLSLAWNQCI